MSFRYNLPYSVTLGPQQHSFLRYPTVPIKPQPMGFFSVTTGSSYADTVLKWGFWIGMGLVAHRLYRVLRYDDPFFQFGGGVPAAWEVNPDKRYIVYAGDWDGNPLVKDSSHNSFKKAEDRAEFVFMQYPSEPRHGGMTVEIVDTHGADYDGSVIQSWMIEQDFRPVEKIQERFLRSDLNWLTYKRLGLPRYVVSYWDNDAVFEKRVKLDSLGKPKFTLHRKREPLPEGLDMREQVLEMYEPGMNLSALSQYLKVSSEKIKRLLQREGIYVPSRRISHADRVRMSKSRRNPDGGVPAPMGRRKKR